MKEKLEKLFRELNEKNIFPETEEFTLFSLGSVLVTVSEFDIDGGIIVISNKGKVVDTSFIGYQTLPDTILKVLYNKLKKLKIDKQ